MAPSVSDKQTTAGGTNFREFGNRRLSAHARSGDHQLRAVIGGGSSTCRSGAECAAAVDRLADALLDERHELTGLPGLTKCLGGPGRTTLRVTPLPEYTDCKICVLCN
jgi:hypothetical protein